MNVRVACVGGAVLDRVYGVEVLPGTDGKTRASSYREFGGGMAGNAAVAIARLGGEARWWGRVGDDAIGAGVLAGLAAEGVATSEARVVEGAVSSHSLVLSDAGGRRAIVLYRSDGLDPDASWLPLAAVGGLDAVLADNRWIDGAVAALSAARAAGLPAVLDADAGADPRSREAVRAASHAIFSEPGLAEIYGTTDPDEGLRRAAADAPFVAVTLGDAGLRWLEAGGGVAALPAFPVTAVETVGAGDVFHGAFALALAEGQPPREALRFAAATAALKCQGSGGRASYPDRAAVEALLARG
ncbi:sugar kinase [Cereibacter sediminicola]|uniref:sugar kinase n=1 Tax=Cereibacter sediminicola TaxID=2584941 RepID=UPI00119F973E|nr:sugar kinase [Cereibacter sediminicola]